jgi:hypothetical protein
VRTGAAARRHHPRQAPGTAPPATGTTLSVSIGATRAASRRFSARK